MTKQEFIQQYVLNRALHIERFDAVGAAEVGAEVWDKIQKIAPKPKGLLSDGEKK